MTTSRRPRVTRKTRAKPPTATPPSTPPAADRLKLELEIHREELATQNEDLRRANALLVSAKERYALLYDRAPSGYFTISADGTLIEVNVAGAAMVGTSRQFLFGRQFDELIAAASRGAFRRFRKGVLEGVGPTTHETLLATGRGLVPVRIEAATLTNALGAEECILCITDESARNELEAERQRSQAQLAESDRLQSLGRLAAGVAHDFNNILSIVLARTELLLLEEGLPSTAFEHLKEVRDATTRAALLSQQMLAYTGQVPIRFAALDLSQVVRANVALLEKLAPARSLRFQLAEHLPAIEGDVGQIGQILSNLVSNAVEALQPGGSVVVRTRHEDGRVLLEVVDDGRGMDGPTRLHAFDPFFTTKFAGRGLGLAVVHGHARTHRATVAIESRLHEGATVRVSFAVAGPPLGAANDVGRDDLVHAERGLILVVDDEMGIRAVASRLLERMGFTVCTARDGIEGLVALSACPDELVAILLDLTMPRLDGSEMLQRLRESSSVTVLLMSGYTKDEVSAEIFALADGFLTKPFTAEGLRRALADAREANRKRVAR